MIPLTNYTWRSPHGRGMSGVRHLYQLLALTILWGCSDSIDPQVSSQTGELLFQEVRLGEQKFTKISGNVTVNVTLTKDVNWLIDGAIFVQDGATLTIEAGTNVYAAFNDATAFVSIQRGGRVDARGTATEPIFFTSVRKLTSIPQPGDWGGIIINGNAPINVEGGEAEGEGGTGLYGGADPTDNSGILRYVIIEYGGKQLGEDNELNGLSLNGVGSGTTLEYIESLYGLDDGIEFFGGTVNLRYALSLGNGDDSFDWTYGWTGMGQFWVAQQDPFDGDSGIEADNNEDNFDATPRSNPTVCNVTLVGANDGDPKNTGVVLRHGTQGTLSNVLAVNFSGDGVRVGESSEAFLSTSDLSFINSRVYDNGVVNEEATAYSNADSFAQDVSNQVTNEVQLQGFVGIIPISFDPATIDPWFLSGSYVGAVNPQDDWTSGWVDLLR